MMTQNSAQRDLIDSLVSREPHKKLDIIAKSIRMKLELDYNMLIVATGGLGKGKSTFGIQLAKRIDPNFRIKDNVIFDFQSDVVKEKILKFPKYSAFVVDEAAQNMIKTGWYEQQQKEMFKLFTYSRKENKAIILCIPSINVLNTATVNNLVNMWFEIYERGQAVAFVRDKNTINSDPWFINQYSKSWGKYAETKRIINMTENKYLDFYRRLPTYFQTLSFPKLNQDEERIYLKEVMAYREKLYKFNEDDIKTENLKIKDSLFNTLKNYRSTLSFQQVLTASGMTEIQLIELFGKTKIKELKRSPKEQKISSVRVGDSSGDNIFLATRTPISNAP